MKTTITIAEIEKLDLEAILLAASMAMSKWDTLNKTKGIEPIWQPHLNKIKYLQNYIKDYPSDTYQILYKLRQL